MSKIDNKEFIKKTQAILKEMGVEVKTTQLYELYSKLSDEKNWNQAKSKDINFAEKLEIKQNIEKSIPFLNMVKDISEENAQSVLKLLFEEEGFKITEINKNDSKEILLVVENEKEVGCVSFSNNITNEFILKLKEEMEKYNCIGSILVSSNESVSSILRKMAADINIEIFDHRDLMEFAKIKIKDLWDLAKDIYEIDKKSPQQVKNIFNLGVSYKDGLLEEVIKKDMEKESNAIFVGSMGSGKSTAMSATVLDYICKNSTNSLVFLMDAVKGAREFQNMFNEKKVYPVLNSKIGIVRVVELAYEELNSRINVFKSERVDSVSSYEKKTLKSLDRVILCFDEFNSINYILNFDEEHLLENTVASKFYTLMRIGRSYGIWVLAATSSVDIPTQILNHFANKETFRVSNSESKILIGSSDASLIKSHQRGLCSYNNGYCQFPYYSNDEQRDMLKKANISSKFNCIYLNKEVIGKYLQGIE